MLSAKNPQNFFSVVGGDTMARCGARVAYCAHGPCGGAHGPCQISEGSWLAAQIKLGWLILVPRCLIFEGSRAEVPAPVLGRHRGPLRHHSGLMCPWPVRM